LGTGAILATLHRSCLPVMDSPTRQRDRGKRQIRFKTTMHGTVVWQVMLWRGWTEVDDDYDWDVFWCADLPEELS
jgi:hypothetical protein